MRTLTILAIALLATAAHAQEVQITPSLKAGDAFRLEITRVRENSARADAELATMTMKMHDDGSFVRDRTFGLMREVIVNRRSNAGKDSRLDRWEIRLVRSPQR